MPSGSRPTGADDRLRKQFFFQWRKRRVCARNVCMRWVEVRLEASETQGVVNDREQVGVWIERDWQGE